MPRAGRYRRRMSTKEEAGRRIKRARNARGLTLEDVAKAIEGFSVSRVSNWEQGLNMIGVDEARKLGPFLDVSAAYLLTLDDNPSDPCEKKLLDCYRHTDERGRAQILRVAESESQYVAPPTNDSKAA